MRAEADVVVATRDRPDMLADCLRSLREQTVAPGRLIVVDSAPSSNATRDLLTDDPDFAAVRYVREARPGLAVAHNRGLREVRAPFVAFTDDDVIAMPEWLERILDAFGAAEDVGCVTGGIVAHELETPAQVWLEGYAGFNKGDRRRVFDLDGNRPDDPLFPLAAGSLGSGANMAFATDALRAMGGFDEALGAGTIAMGGDDLAAFLDVIARGHRLVYEPSALVRHRHRRGYEDLRRQVHGYGVGLTAYLTRSALAHPGLAARSVTRLPRAVAHVLSPGSARNARRAADYPRELVRIERRGMASGPLAYARSRRAARRHASAALPILLYHSVSDDPGPRFGRWAVSPELFDAHMGHLEAAGFTTVTVSELVARRTAGTLDPRTVAVTFDDGFADFHAHALPTLARRSQSATLYVTTGHLGGTSSWLDDVGEGGRPMLSWSQLREVHAAGIEVGAHTRTHPQLDTIPRASAREEITGSRRALMEGLDAPVASFAYPHGYHSRGVVAEVRRAGFTSACGVVHALSGPADDDLALSRIIVDGGTDAAGLERLMRGEGLTRRRRPVRRTAWRAVRTARRVGAGVRPAPGAVTG